MLWRGRTPKTLRPAEGAGRGRARHVCPFVEMSRTGKSMWVDSRSVVARAGEGGAGSDC